MTFTQRERTYKLFLLAISLTLISLSLLSPAKLIEFSVKGLDLCGRCIIPSLFPFMIFSDMLISSEVFENMPRVIKSAFERLFKIPSVALGAFLAGSLCGFPLGIKHACDLYAGGKLTREECERLICFANNTGPSFIIAGIGVSMRKSVFEGLSLYIIQVISSVICGILISKNATFVPAERKINLRKNSFCFSDTVKRSATSTLYVCGFVTFFSIVCGFCRTYIDNEFICATLCSFLEVGNASALCSQLSIGAISFSLCAFAISFSGISVHMQARVFTDQTDLNLRKYYFAKLFQALLSFCIALLTFSIL